MAKLKFQVVLENIELSKAQQSSIQKEINAVVARHVLKTKKTAASAAPAVPLYGYAINPEWLGIWIKSLKNIGDLKDLKLKNLNKLAGV